MWVGILYLTSDAGVNQVRDAYAKNRSLMRAFAMELLEWWDSRLRETNSEELRLDELDLELLAKAHEDATTAEAAREIGITFSRAKARYENLYKKLDVRTRRQAVEKAIALGLLKGSS